MTTDMELLAATESLRHILLDYFEGMQARDGALISVDQMYDMIDELTRTEIREAVHELRPEQDLLEAGREAEIKVVFYRPLAPYRAALRMCHLEASPEGTVPTLRVKLLLQAYVFLNQEQRDECLRELVSSRLKAIRAGTMRRAAVDQLLHDSLITFRVAPERS